MCRTRRNLAAATDRVSACAGRCPRTRRALTRTEGQTREDVVGLSLLCRVERREQLLGSCLHGTKLRLPLLAHFGHKGEAIRGAHFAHHVRIDALSRRLHGGCGVLDSLGVFRPGGS